MKTLYLSLIAFLTLFGTAPADVIDTVSDLLARGSSHELTKLFAPEVEIALPGIEADTHPKAEAGIMLEKFFAQNKPVASKVLHRINAAASFRFGVVVLTTAKGTYRVSFNLKEDKGTATLVKLMIEPERVK
jgi:hypothetical protein